MKWEKKEYTLNEQHILKVIKSYKDEGRTQSLVYSWIVIESNPDSPTTMNPELFEYTQQVRTFLAIPWSLDGNR